MAYRKNNKNHQSGFTLIEVIAVLVIVGVVAAVVVSRMTSSSSFSLVSETDILKGHLRYAQYRAMSYTERWGISFSTGSYSLVSPTATTSNLPNEESSTHTLPSGITVSSNAESGGTVYFNEWGNPVTNSGSLLPDTTITLTYGSTTRTVTITQNTGFIE